MTIYKRQLGIALDALQQIRDGEYSGVCSSGLAQEAIDEIGALKEADEKSPLFADKSGDEAEA